MLYRIATLMMSRLRFTFFEAYQVVYIQRLDKSESRFNRVVIHYQHSLLSYYRTIQREEKKSQRRITVRNKTHDQFSSGLITIDY